MEHVNPIDKNVEQSWLAGLKRFRENFPELAAKSGLVAVAEQSVYRQLNDIVGKAELSLGAYAGNFAYRVLLETFLQFANEDADDRVH